MIYFNAPNGDKDELLALGAKWNSRLGKWCVKSHKDYKKFSRWIKGKVICRELYFLEVEEVCPFCHKNTRLIAVACGAYTEDFLPAVYGKGKINVFYGFERFPADIAAWLKKHYPVKYRYFVPYGYKYLSNGCGNCNKLYPDPYLFEDEDSPFYIGDDSKAGKFTVYTVKLNHDIAISGMIAFEYQKRLFTRNGKFIRITDLNI